MVYIFKCSTCGQRIEVQRSLNDGVPSSVGCPTGCGEAVRDWRAEAVNIDRSSLK